MGDVFCQITVSWFSSLFLSCFLQCDIREPFNTLLNFRFIVQLILILRLQTTIANNKNTTDTLPTQLILQVLLYIAL